MDPNLGATIITVVGGALFATAMFFVTKKKPGLNEDDDPDPGAVVREVASGHKSYGPEALIAMAQMLTSQGARIDALEVHKRTYLKRIAVLEHWGAWAAGPPPRLVPDWPDDPEREPSP